VKRAERGELQRKADTNSNWKKERGEGDREKGEEGKMLVEKAASRAGEAPRPGSGVQRASRTARALWIGQRNYGRGQMIK
jgi:hypothetical protein